MYEICRLLAATAPKAKKVRKVAVKAVSIGARIVMHNDNQEYTIVERDTRYKNAWFIAHDVKGRAPFSFSRDMFTVL